MTKLSVVSPTSIRSRILKARRCGVLPVASGCFTHVDPFEDTESLDGHDRVGENPVVSPTSIRSRILKDTRCGWGRKRARVSPTSIRSRILKV